MNWQAFDEWGIYATLKNGALVYAPMLETGEIDTSVSVDGGIPIEYICPHLLETLNGYFNTDFSIADFTEYECQCVMEPERVEVAPA